MGLQLRVATDDDWLEICAVDGRTFGINYTEESRDEARRMIDLSRFRVVTDGAEIVGVAGSYAFDVALPGGAAVPMGGVTWVSVATTHRRQGILRMLMAACHDDIDERGEPVASLYASDSGIYGRFGYGLGTQIRSCSIDTRATSVLERFRPAPGAVRFVTGDETERVLTDLWDRSWRTRAGEVHRTAADIDFYRQRRNRPEGNASAVHYLVHPDGYLAYRITGDWGGAGGAFPRHEVSVVETVALTVEARAALWHALLSMDLVATVTTTKLAIDDPLPFLLGNSRAVRTVNVTDGVWVNVRDVAVAFGARSYASADRLVVEADGRRWAIEGGPDGGHGSSEVRAVRTKPDIVTGIAELGSLLYGGVAPSTLAAAGRLTARSADALRRADLFFPTPTAPFCQTMY